MATRKTSTKKDSSNPLALASAALDKTFKGEYGSVELDPNQLKESRAHLSSGSIVLDYMIGGRPNAHGVPPCPGLPRGAVCEIWGHEGAGKTTVALSAAAKTCASGSPTGGPGTVVYVDWEHAVDPAYAKTIGVPIEDPSRFKLVQPHSFEQGLGVIWAMVKAGVDLVVIDSIAAGVPESHQAQKDDEKGDMGRVGLLAAKWSKFLPEVMREAAASGTTILGISQLRKKIAKGPAAAYGPDTAPMGGEAWKFYSWVRIGLRRAAYEKGKVYDPITNGYIETAVSSEVVVKLEKCKVSASQGREGKIRITFGEGIDNLRSVIDIAVAHRIISKSGASLTWNSSKGEIKGAGMAKFKDAIKATNGAAIELYGQVFSKLTSMSDGLSMVAEEEDQDDLSDLDAIMNEKVEVPAEGEMDSE